MANPYLNPIKQEYTPHSVPIPFEYMLQAGKAKQDQYDATEETTYKLQDLMSKVNAMPLDEQHKKDLEAKYYPQLEEISSSLQTGDVRNARQKLMETSIKWSSDPDRRTLENNYQNYLQTVKTIEDYKKDYKYFDEANPLLKFAAEKKAGGNKLIPYSFKGMTAWSDPAKDSADLMKDIKLKLKNTGTYEYDDQGRLVNKHGSLGVDTNDIMLVAQAQTEAFLGTNGGRAFTEKMLARGIKPKDIQKQATNLLYNEGLKQVQYKSEKLIDVTDSPEYRYNLLHPLNPDSNEGTTVLPAFDKIANPLNDKTLTKQEARNLTNPTTSELVKTAWGSAAAGTSAQGISNKEIRYPVYTELSKASQSQIESIVEYIDSNNKNTENQQLWSDFKTGKISEENKKKLFDNIEKLSSQYDLNAYKESPKVYPVKNTGLNESAKNPALDETRNYFTDEHLNSAVYTKSTGAYDITNHQQLTTNEVNKLIKKVQKYAKSSDSGTSNPIILINGKLNGAHPISNITGDVDYAAARIITLPVSDTENIQLALPSLSNTKEGYTAQTINNFYDLKTKPFRSVKFTENVSAIYFPPTKVETKNNPQATGTYKLMYDGNEIPLEDSSNPESIYEKFVELVKAHNTLKGTSGKK